jgi:hypothetical protein
LHRFCSNFPTQALQTLEIRRLTILPTKNRENEYYVLVIVRLVGAEHHSLKCVNASNNPRDENLPDEVQITVWGPSSTARVNQLIGLTGTTEAAQVTCHSAFSAGLD